MLDAESIVSDSLADLLRPYPVLSRSCENSGKFCGRDGHDGTSAALSEENVFGSDVIYKRNVRAQEGHSMPCSYGGRSGGRGGSEAGFSQRDGEATIADVMGGLQRAIGSQRDQAIDQAFLSAQINRRWFAGHDSRDRFGILRRRKFTRSIL